MERSLRRGTGSDSIHDRADRSLDKPSGNLRSSQPGRNNARSYNSRGNAYCTDRAHEPNHNAYTCNRAAHSFTWATHGFTWATHGCSRDTGKAASDLGMAAYDQVR
jgi:hypothetical protein